MFAYSVLAPLDLDTPETIASSLQESWIAYSRGMTTRIARAIRRSGYRQVEVARAIGLSPQTMSDRVRGKTRWSLTEAARLARFIEVPLEELAAEVEADAASAEQVTAS